MIESLTDVRVIDVTVNVAGPFATQILADMGADVIKVERPRTGDDTRAWGPPRWSPDTGVTFSDLNRNKRSIALDLSDDTDRTTFEELVCSADVLVQNLRPGAFHKLGYGWENLRQLNPYLIYAEMLAFGGRGPRRNEPGYDPMMQAFSGLMSINGHRGDQPARVPVSILDKGTGMWTALGILNALRARDRTGEGLRIETSLLDTAISWESNQILNYLAGAPNPQPNGSRTSMIAPYQAFESEDGYIVIAAGNDRLWGRFCQAIGSPRLIDDERFASNADRVRNVEELTSELAPLIREHTTHYWLEAFAAGSVPCAPVNTIEAMLGDTQVEAVGSLVREPIQGAPDFAMIHTPIRTNDQRFALRYLPPALNEHGKDIRGGLVNVEADGTEVVPPS